jgi:AbrB family looped-hinge helix DNA binding protein
MATSNILVENAKVMAKGQITLPKDIREILGVGMGDRVTLICRDN